MRVRSREGYAAKYFFAPQETTFEHEKEPWYFDDVQKKEAESLLRESINPDGSFLIRQYKEKLFLTVKTFDKKPDGEGGFKYVSYDIKSDEELFWFGLNSFKDKKFESLKDLIKFCKENSEFFGRVTNSCLLTYPHADPGFVVANKKGYDAIKAPVQELKTIMEIGSGQFGNVHKAKFRTLDVAAKQLKVEDTEEDEGARVLEEFFSEINIMKKFNHPNLVHLFGYIESQTKGNFMIVEFMAHGDLKDYLKKLKADPQRLRREEKLWKKLLTWCIEAARGMDHLDKLKIVHRDLAAR